MRWGLLSWVVLAPACRPDADPLTRAAERALGDCSYTVDDDTTDAVRRGSYSADGDLVLREDVDPSTGDVAWQWKATYHHHDVIEERTYAPAGELVTVVSYRRRPGRVTILTDNSADGDVDSRDVQTVDDGRTERSEYDMDADDQVDVVLEWVWTETNDGWTVDRTEVSAEGDAVPIGSDRYDAELRLLASTSDSGERHEDVLVEGYGDLTWAEHERDTIAWDADGADTTTIDLRRTLDDVGRVLEEDATYQDTSHGELVGVLSWHADWAWTCP